MPIDNRVIDLFYAMTSYSKSIYENMQVLCELEKAGKKTESAYYNHLKKLKELLKEENKLYKDNIDLIFSKRGEFAGLAINNSSDVNCNMFDLLSWFNDSIIFERIKKKLKYYVGLKTTFDNDILRNLKLDEYVERRISETFLDDSFLSDIQKVSMFYMDKDHLEEKRNIDYKYISALLFDFDIELAGNFFELSKNNIYLDSSLVHTLSGIFNHIYEINSDEVLKQKFIEYVDYIRLENDSLDDDSDYKIDIALSYLKAILDLLSDFKREEVYNDFLMGISDNFDIPNDLKMRMVNALNDTGYSRKLLNRITINQGQFD